jgi:hypothetical protein
MNRCEVELDLPPDEARARVAEAAAAWDGQYEDERLALPVVFGLRRGVALGKVEIVRLGDTRCRVAWTLEESRLDVHRASVAVLLFAAIPLVITVAWPFHPPLFALVPFAAVSGLAAWWLVVSRLRSRGPAEFFAALGESSPPDER